MAATVTQGGAAAVAPLPPADLDAEESVLGGLMLAGAGDLVERVQETGLEPTDFYRPSHGAIWRAIVALHQEHKPYDAIAIADKLDERGELEEVGGKERIHELAALAPASSNAAHYAKIVCEMATLRGLTRVGEQIQRLGWDRPGETPQLVGKARELVDQLETRAFDDLTPLWWHEAIHEPLPDTSEYVEGVLQTGVLADIVGLPYLHKTAVALELAAKIAAGQGNFLGRYPITQQARVAYFWGDDSRVKELERIQAYAKACARDVLPVGFYLNPGIAIPDGLPALKQQIRRHEYRLVVFDSLYNFAPGIDWVKDTGQVTALYAALKRLCDEIDGLTIILVDHASKPSDANRGRDPSVASFGSVWKAASVRCSIVITKDNNALHVQAVGNNIKGFPRTPAIFNETRLELHLLAPVEPDPEREEQIEDRVLEEIRRRPGQSSRQLEKNVKGRARDVRAAVRRLEEKNLVLNTYGTASQLLGTRPDALSPDHHENRVPHEPGRARTHQPKSAWIPLDQAKKPRPGENGTHPDAPRPDTVTKTRPESASRAPSPIGEVQGRSSDAATEHTWDDPDADFRTTD